MTEARRMTMVTLTIVVDREMSWSEFEQLCIPKIKSVCSFKGDKYTSEAWVERLDYRELRVIPRGG